MIVASKHQISKRFDFCYGHRVHTQNLDNPDLSISVDCKCKHLHGHQGSIEIVLSSSALSKEGMVTDFHNLSFMKTFIDQYLDHKMILDISDPLVEDLKVAFGIDSASMVYDPDVNVRYVDDLKVRSIAVGEVVEGLIFVPFTPTSENFARWIFDYVKKVFRNSSIDGVNVDSVIFKETPKTQAVYQEETVR